MPLWLIVTLIVLSVTAVMGVTGYLIDKSARPHERNEDR